MCVAIPAKIVEMDAAENRARAVLAGNTIDVNIRLVSPSIGDYVLVHAGCAVEILQRARAEEILSLLDELAEAAGDP